MFKYIFSKVAIYLIILIFIVPAIILFLLGDASKKQIKNNASVIPAGSPSSLPVESVPLPSKEDVIRTFCNLIDEGRISEAVGMMDISDDTIRQSWGVSLNNFSLFKLININNSAIDESGNSFEVDIDVILKKDITDSPIPNYGWENGMNKKWINIVEKEKGVYKIIEIATGP